MPHKATKKPEAGGWYKPPGEKGRVILPALPDDIKKYEAKGYEFVGYVEP